MVFVVLDHLFGWPAGGFVGVDVFFVISGFLITGLLLREHEKSGTISFGGFYRRRLRRIAPAATIVLAVTSIAAWIVFNTTRATATSWDAIWGFFFAANWHFAAVGTDYFQSAGPVSPLQHYWSLAVEEQFYFVWLWLMLLTYWVVAKLGNNAGQHYARRSIGIAMVIITVGSFSWALWESEHSSTVAYFSTFSRAWELGVGALVAVYAGKLTAMSWRIRPVVAWLGLVMITAGFFLIDGETLGFPAPWALLPVIGAALVIAAGIGGSARFLVPITNPVAQYLGNISYSLYLWHFPVIVVGAVVLGDAPMQKVILLAVAVLLSAYTYHLVEDPIRRSSWLERGVKTDSKRRRRLSKKRSTVTTAYRLTALSLLALGTVLVVAVALGSTASKPPTAADLAAAAAPETVATDAPVSRTPLADALSAEVAIALQTTTWPELSPSMDETVGASPTPPEVSACGKSVVINEEKCTWGDPNASHTIVTVGSSLSLAYVAAIRDAIGTNSGWRVISYGMFGCPFDTQETISGLTILPNGCSERPRDAVAAINRLQPDVVIFSGLFSAVGPAAEAANIDPAVKFVFMPGPPAEADIGLCYSKVSEPADCVTHVDERWGNPERNMAASVSRPGTFIDTLAWFCFNDECPAFVGTSPMKVDKTHISPTFAAKIAPVMLEAFHLSGVIPE